jgi:hypothetical protein
VVVTRAAALATALTDAITAWVTTPVDP